MLRWKQKNLHQIFREKILNKFHVTLYITSPFIPSLTALGASGIFKHSACFNVDWRMGGHMKYTSKDREVDKQSKRQAGALSTQGLWMTSPAVHHQLLCCCLSWMNSWQTGGSCGDGSAFLSVMIKTNIPHSSKEVHVCSALQRSYWKHHKLLQSCWSKPLPSAASLPGWFGRVNTGSPSVP